MDIEFPRCPIKFDCGLHYSIQIDSFEATTEPWRYGNDEIEINYILKGITSNSRQGDLLFVICYDGDGNYVDDSIINLGSATGNEPFEIKDSIIVDASTARIEFAVY